MKDLAKMAALFATIVTCLMGVLTFVHAQMTIPQILNETADVVEKAMDRHVRNGRHATALGINEFRMWATEREKNVEKFGDQVIRRLDENVRRLERIEEELRKR